VSAYDANNAWAVGAYYDTTNGSNHVIIEHWNGTSWSLQTVANPGAHGNYLYGVKAFSATNIWAVGYYFDANYEQHVLIEHSTDGGNTWSQDTGSYYGSGDLQAIDGDISSGDAWAVGIDGSTNALTLHLVNGHFLQQTNVTPNSNTVLYSVSEHSSSDVWAVGVQIYNGYQHNTFTMHYDGNNWTAYSSPSPSDESCLFGVTAIGTNNAWAVGEVSDFNNTDTGSLIHWNGIAWSTTPNYVNVGSVSTLYSIATSDSNDIWAAGLYASNNNASQLIWHSSDAGSTWEQSSTENPSSGRGYFNGITFDKDSGNGWAVGTAGDLLSNSNTFIEQYTPPTPLGGTWISPGNNFPITGNTIHFAAHAYGGAGVDHVNFTAWWSGVNPKIWAIACTVTSPTPGTTDVYECDWTSSATLPNGSLRMNLAGVPRGPIMVSFDVYDKAGNSILAPNGTRQGTMQTGWGQGFSYPIGVPDKSGLRQPTGWNIEQDFNQPNGSYNVCATLRQSDGNPDCYHSGEDWQKVVNGIRRGDVTAGQNVYPIAPGRLTWIHTTGTYPGDVIMLEHQTPRGLVYSMYAHVLPSADLLNAFQQGQHPYISNIEIPIATVVPWPGDITNSHLHFEIRGFFKDNDIINNGVFNCGCEVGPGYWLWSRGGPEAKGWLRPSLVIQDSRQ